MGFQLDEFTWLLLRMEISPEPFEPYNIHTKSITALLACLFCSSSHSLALLFLSLFPLKMSSFFAKALTIGVLAAPVFAAPSSMVKKSQIISTSAKQAAIDLCGTSDNLVLYDTPWIVYNMFYDAAGSVGTQCTRYDHVETPATGDKKIVWSSETNIEYVKAT